MVKRLVVYLEKIDPRDSSKETVSELVKKAWSQIRDQVPSLTGVFVCSDEYGVSEIEEGDLADIVRDYLPELVDAALIDAWRRIDDKALVSNGDCLAASGVSWKLNVFDEKGDNLIAELTVAVFPEPPVCPESDDGERCVFYESSLVINPFNLSVSGVCERCGSVEYRRFNEGEHQYEEYRWKE